MTAGPALAPDAAIVLGIASTAMPFARTPEEGAERWLRILRIHGDVGAGLQALGVSEGPLWEPAEADRKRTARGGVDDGNAVANVTEQAILSASRRGANGVTTTDLLMAVMHVYGPDFDRVLLTHGTDREEVIERLGLISGSEDG